ncbi:MAG: phosphatidate cytidylyltransferase, partial [Chloroflexi bacterium]|nr:phosphatidate cytidylyltransferase [Chloroflexota bacterium]
PRISPNKTVEGALGGWVVGFTAVVLLRYLPNIEVEYWKMVLLALALPPAAQIGDLAASVMKRAVDVKDFSRLIPGHGGVLDRLDSMLVGVPVVYFFVRWVVL